MSNLRCRECKQEATVHVWYKDTILYNSLCCHHAKRSIKAQRGTLTPVVFVKRITEGIAG